MITDKLRDALERQVGHELAASQHYLGIAAYFGLENLDKWADIFYAQSQEEREHALKIIRFLIDVDKPFTFPSVAESKTSYGSAQEALQWALDNERQVTKQFKDMAEAALQEKDYTAFQFLQWFIEEQVEEEATMDKYVALLKSEANPFRAEMIISELEEHGGS